MVIVNANTIERGTIVDDLFPEYNDIQSQIKELSRKLKKLKKKHKKLKSRINKDSGPYSIIKERIRDTSRVWKEKK